MQTKMGTSLYHLVPADQWQSCKASETQYYPPTYQQDGFIHLTADPKLLLTVANHFYKNVAGDWIVLKLDADRLKSEVKFEPAAPVGEKASAGLLGETSTSEPLFPHLYGTIDFDSVVEELRVTRDTDGTFLSIAGIS